MNNFLRIIKNIDLIFCRYLSIVSPEKPALIVFNFHKIFKNKLDIFSSGIDPQQGTTLDDFRFFIEYFLSAGYIFVHPGDILGNLNPTKKYILITFDDGYFNNSYLLPIIKEYKTPTIFFITSNNVLYNEAFWWDLIYRLKLNGAQANQLAGYKRIIKKMDPIKTKEFLKIELSIQSFSPINDYDRPFNAIELKEFSNEPYVIIGNHTADHAILTNCSKIEIKNQITKAQNDLENITGKIPRFLSYPNGNFSNTVLEIVESLNFELCFTSIRGKNILPIIEPSSFQKIRRFNFPKNYNANNDGSIFRSNFSLYNSGINFYSKFKLY